MLRKWVNLANCFNLERKTYYFFCTTPEDIASASARENGRRGGVLGFLVIRRVQVFCAFNVRVPLLPSMTLKFQLSSVELNEIYGRGSSTFYSTSDWPTTSKSSNQDNDHDENDAFLLNSTWLGELIFSNSKSFILKCFNFFLEIY